jgi:hypothetical protein
MILLGRHHDRRRQIRGRNGYRFWSRRACRQRQRRARRRHKPHPILPNVFVTVGAAHGLVAPQSRALGEHNRVLTGPDELIIQAGIE